MTPRQTRTLVRSAHLVLGVIIGSLVYLPTAWTEPWRPLVGFVVVPLVVITGLTMWQQARLRRWFGRSSTRPPAGQPDADPEASR